MKLDLGLIFIALLMVYFLHLIRGDIMQNRDLLSEKSLLSAKIKQVEEESRAYALEIKSAGTQNTIERLARERLNFTKKGEIAFKICR